MGEREGQGLCTKRDSYHAFLRATSHHLGGRRRGHRNGPGTRRDRTRATNGKPRAKWVDVTEREKRRKKRLCFCYGAGGHRIRECQYAPAVQPTTIDATVLGPMLEDDDEESDPDTFGLGKA
jgi:hypothetical protein